MFLSNSAGKLSAAVFASVVLLVTFASAQWDHEYAPIEEKKIEYKDWTYPNASGEGKTNLRDFIKGKKLVLVFYFAPWCHSSRFQAPVTQRFYEDYGKLGLGIIGVSMYGSVEDLSYELKTRKLTFPVVVETTKLTARKSSPHFNYRVSTGDNRKWGTPWNIFLFPSRLNEEGDVLTTKTFVANGELREEGAEDFIRKHLGLPPLDPDSGKAKAEKQEVIEECKTDGASDQAKLSDGLRHFQ